MSNGNQIGPYVKKDIYSASGIWRPSDIARSKRATNSWPLATNDTLTYRTTATAAGTTTLTHPVDVVAGDLCVICHSVYSTGSDVLLTSPSGFDTLSSRYLQISGANYTSSMISYAVLADTTNVTLPIPFDIVNAGNGVAANQRYRALYFYLDRNILTLRSPKVGSVASTGDPGTITIDLTPYAQGTPLLYIAHAHFQTGTGLSFTTETPTLDATFTNTTTSNILIHTGYKIYNNPADVGSTSIDIADLGGGQSLVAGFLAVQGT